MVELVLSTTIEAPIERCFDLARSIDLHLLGAEKTGERAVGGITSGLIGMDEFVRWEARHLGVSQNLASRITAYNRPLYFQDTMVEGAFRFMKHDHYFKASSPNSTEMTDTFVFAAPLGLLGVMVEKVVLKPYMLKFLEQRNRVLKRVAESDQWISLLSVAK